MAQPMPEIHLDTIFKIMEFLSYQDGLSVLSVCKAWYELDRFEILWKTLLSNFILLKIHDYRSLVLQNSKEQKEQVGKESQQGKRLILSYKNLINHLEKFHQTQIVKEKTVNRASFEKYMDDDYHDPTEKSTVFGMRFKKLASSALLMHYNLMMRKGLVEIKENFTYRVVNYEHPSSMAAYFLNQAKKFTLKERVKDESIYAVEYWNRFANSISDLVLYFLSNNHYVKEPERYVIKFFENFKPILNDNTLLSAIITTSESVLSYLLKYISIDGNYEKSEISELFIDIGGLIGRDLKKLVFLKKCFNILYPNMWLTNFDKVLNYKRISYHMDLFNAYDYKAQEVVDNICLFLQIFEQNSIDFSKIRSQSFLPSRHENEVIDLLIERGLLSEYDYKIVFHAFYFTSNMLTKIKNFGPYEIVETSRGKFNFVLTYFKTHTRLSINSTFELFFKDYHQGKFDLNIPINAINDSSEGIAFYRKKINSKICSHFLDYFAMDDISESLDIMINKFTPSLDVSCIEEITNYFAHYFVHVNSYHGLTNQHMIDSFQYAIRNIQHEGIPFEQYCQGIIHKYADPGLTLDYEIFYGEERMAKLYYLTQHILDEMPKWFYLDNQNY